MIEVYLEVKDSIAKGLYNQKEGTIIVLAGSIIVSEVSNSFHNHNYMSLRKEILRDLIVEDFTFIKDYKFNSLSAAAAVISGRSANGPLEWKLANGSNISEFLEQQHKNNTFITFYKENKSIKKGFEAYKEAETIREKFPLSKIKEMQLNDYDELGTYSSLMYYVEYKTKVMSGSSLGSSANKLFYYRRKDNKYHNVNYIEALYPNISVKERFALYKNDLYNFINDFDVNNYKAEDYDVLPKSANIIKSKLINIYYPDTILAIDSKNMLSEILTYFGKKPALYEDSIEMNIALFKKIYEVLPDLKDLNIWDLSEIILEFYIKYIDVEIEEVIVDSPVVENDSNNDLFIEDSLVTEIVTLINKKKNIILQGSPGVGKTFSVKRIINNNFNIINSKEQSLTIQFHQSFSYEEFIEGLRPTIDGSGFRVQPGIFKRFIEENVIPNPKKPYFLIIDEINRGNLSKIFGELLMLIEADKRGNTNSVKLPYSGENFYVPSNLYVIGTMNTADRSLALIDYALRRRFSFVELTPKFNTLKFNEHLRTMGLTEQEIKRLNKVMTYINNIISEDLSPNFKIGHSYFVDSKVTDFESWFQTIIKYDIIPLLKEYYFDDTEQVRKILIDLGLENV